MRLIAVSISLAGVVSIECTGKTVSAIITLGMTTESETEFDKLPDDASADAASLYIGVGVETAVLAAIGAGAVVAVSVDVDGAIVSAVVGCATVSG